MIKGKYVVLIVVVLLLLVGGTRYFSIAKQKQTLKQDVKTHLTDIGYEETDIKMSYIVNISNYFTNYALVVTFKDELGVEYFYGYENGEIMQIDAVHLENKGTFKHREKET